MADLMKPLQERAERVMHKIDVAVPTLDGSSVAYRIEVEVPALKDPLDGEIYLDGEAQEIIDRTKARHMGLMSPEAIKDLRELLGVTQKVMSGLLQIGAKTYTRWESGGDHPSRSLNILLCALRDGRIDTAYLQSLRPNLEAPQKPWSEILHQLPQQWIAAQRTFAGNYENKPLAA